MISGKAIPLNDNGLGIWDCSPPWRIAMTTFLVSPYFLNCGMRIPVFDVSFLMSG